MRSAVSRRTKPLLTKSSRSSGFWKKTLRELRSKFKRSTLGWLWSVINPLANIAIYTVIFGVFLKVAPPVGDPSGLEVYGFFLVCGLLPWTFLTSGLNGAAASIVTNEGLVKKVYFPRWVLPAASTLAWLANFGVELIVLGVVLLVAGNLVVPWIPVVIALMALEAGFVLGLGLLLSAANAYFRDVQHFMAIALNIWFYATPILYPPEQIPADSEFLGVAVRDLLAPVVTGQDAELAAIQRILIGEQYMTVYKAIKPEAEAAAELAVALVRGEEPPADLINGETDNGMKAVPSVLLEPVAVTTENIQDTIVKDEFYPVDEICSGQYASACKEAGIQ
jgi:ABC-type polysaccharide/polyol phosphate export permease